jgi:hypothetical protein
MERFNYLKRMHAKKMSKQHSNFGVKSYAKKDPLADLLEDLLQEMNNRRALKDEKEEKRSSS